MSKPSRKKLCGIYCIENLANGKRYIGQSKNVERRINNHKNLLRKNEHHNEYLQRAWNKYGENCFQFYIICSCSESVIDNFERFYISLYNTTNDNFGYNLESGGNIGKKHSPKTIEKLIKIHKSERVQIYCIELDKIYDGFVEIEKEYNVAAPAIRRCCDEKCGTSCGYHWLYLSDKTKENIKYALSYKNQCKKEVYCFELDKKFESETEAEMETGASHIGCCCKKERSSSGRHPKTNVPLHWCFADEIDTYEIRKKVRKKIIPQMRKEIICNETQNVYQCAKEAGNALSICCSHIYDVCNGKRKSVGGYTFRYTEDKTHIVRLN